MPARVTLADLAKAAGVSKASVSFALNGYPKVSEELRKRVKKLAAELGYKRDPVLARIAASRWKSPHAPVGTVLAFVAFPRPLDFAGGRRRVVRSQNYPEFLAAVERADELGYRMEFFNYAAHAEAEKLSKLLRNRGIPGVVFGPIYQNEFVERFRWEWFASVAIFDGYVVPPVDQFTPSYVHALQSGWQRAMSAGFKRPGLVLFREQREHHINFVLVSAMEHLQHELPAINRLPVHYYETPAHLAEWQKKHRPDVVIGYNDAHYWALREGGVDVPGSTAYLSLLRAEHAPGQTNPAAGLAISHRELAQHAVDRLDSMLRRGETGLPEFPFVHRMISPWRDGESFPVSQQVQRNAVS
jgi:DNA-binding LacI/PurR family transcriptional regulator